METGRRVRNTIKSIFRLIPCHHTVRNREGYTPLGGRIVFSDIVTISRSCLLADFPRRLHKMAETPPFTWHYCRVHHKIFPLKLGCQVQALEWVTIKSNAQFELA